METREADRRAQNPPVSLQSQLFLKAKSWRAETPTHPAFRQRGQIRATFSSQKPLTAKQLRAKLR